MEARAKLSAQARWVTWVWLFPATYAVHIVEEYFGGEGFPAWASRHTGLSFSEPRFLAINTVALIAMLICASLVSLIPAFRLLLATLGTAVVVNGLLHLATSILTRSYSPGLVSGMLLWLPLGGSAIVASYRSIPRKQFWAAVILGVLAHLLVTAVAIGVSRSPSDVSITTGASSLLLGRSWSRLLRGEG